MNEAVRISKAAIDLDENEDKAINDDIEDHGYTTTSVNSSHLIAYVESSTMNLII